MDFGPVLQESAFVPFEAQTQLPHARVLVCAPHPDDEVFGCGGAILQHLAQGDPVQVLILSDGQAAEVHPDPQARRFYIETRRAESRCAGDVLGYGEPVCWDCTDRELAQVEDLAARLGRHIEAVGADLIYAPSLNEIHPDHYATARAAITAVRDLPGDRRLAFYEVGAPCGPNYLLDISRHLGRKRRAQECFASQLQLHAYLKFLGGLEHYRTYTLPPQVEAAEGFFFTNAEALRQRPELGFGSSRLNAYLEREQTRLALREAELARVYRSRWWRLGGPLRRLRRWLGRSSA